jgi:hypothetical protein
MLDIFEPIRSAARAAGWTGLSRCTVTKVGGIWNARSTVTVPRRA